MCAFASFSNLRNIPDQLSNPAGIRRVGVVAVSDLLSSVADWPRAVGSKLDIDLGTKTIVNPVPLKLERVIAVIEFSENSAFMSFENQGDRFYQSYKHSIGFDLAGLTKTQSVEMKKYINTGCIFFSEYHDGEIRVVGSKLNPIVLRQKGDTGKKSGDKRGYILSGDNDSYTIEPPFYPDTMWLPGMIINPVGFSYGFSLAFNS